MAFARKVWKLLVAIKDGLALLFLLLFFMAIYAVLTARPGPGKVHDGALLLDFNGIIVEEPSIPDPLEALIASRAPIGEYRARDIVRALRLAAKDDRIKAVVLDLSGFIGGGPVHIKDIGDALEEVRKAKKPILAYGIAYLDDGLLLAAHADEVWMDPNGAAFATGPGGNSIYFARLLETLKITANIYRVGTFKSAVEPWTLDGPSEATRRAYEALYGTIWEEWKADYLRARPKADLDLVTSDPVGWVKASGGDTAQAGMAAGLVDKLGTPTEFGIRVAEIAGQASGDKMRGHFASTGLSTWLAANKPESRGKAIGVITVAGEIVDGNAGPGLAGGDRIVRLLDEALDRDFAALVIRVDSPGGSVIASERIRRAIDRYKARGIPIVASMANVAASGGYWVATPADRIFAEPSTTTGSIGVFAILPTFDKALNELGVTGAGVRTTPLSGQPDVLTGLAPEVSPMLQASIEAGYNKFLGLVSKSRGIPVESAQDWADGHPWDGGVARQLKLIDEFGGLDEALAYAAKAAKLGQGDWHAEFLGGGGDPFAALLQSMQTRTVGSVAAPGDMAGIAAFRQQAQVAQLQARFSRLLSVRGMQAYCLECPGLPRAQDTGIPLEVSKIPAILSLLTAR